MNWAILVVIGAVLLPGFLVPAYLSFRNRQPHAPLLLAANLLVVAALPFAAGALLAVFLGVRSALGGVWPMVVVLGAWTGLLWVSRRGPAGEIGSGAGGTAAAAPAAGAAAETAAAVSTAPAPSVAVASPAAAPTPTAAAVRSDPSSSRTDP